jgi:adenosine kinase
LRPNIAYGLALLGERPYLLATAGHDAAEYRDALAAAGVDVAGLVLDPELFTASFFVSTDEDQNQIASFYTGAMARARELSIREHGGGTPAALVIVSPNDPEAMRRYADECRRLGIPFLYDPSQQVARLTGEELLEGMRGAEILIVNDYELGIIAQKTALGIEALEERVPVLVTTHGADGSTISVDTGADAASDTPFRPRRSSAKRKTRRGSADAYRAGLVRGIRLALPWEVAGRMGSVAAVFGLEAMGPQPPRYSAADFRARYERNFGAEPLLDRLA